MAKIKKIKTNGNGSKPRPNYTPPKSGGSWLSFFFMVILGIAVVIGSNFVGPMKGWIKPSKNKNNKEVNEFETTETRPSGKNKQERRKTRKTEFKKPKTVAKTAPSVRKNVPPRKVETLIEADDAPVKIEIDTSIVKIPEVGEAKNIKSSYKDCKFDEAALLKRDYVSLVANNTLHTLHRAQKAKEIILQEVRQLDKSYWGTPTVIYLKTKDGVKSFNKGSVIDCAEMAAPWVLISMTGDKDAAFDIPIMFAMGKKPTQIDFTTPAKIIAKFATPDTGWIGRVQPWGYRKLRQKEGKNWLKENGEKDIGPFSFQWQEKFPKDVEKRCDYWTQICRAFPVGYKESFSVDREKGTVTTLQEYKWLTTEDDWKTVPIKFAAIPPTLGFTQIYPIGPKFKISFSAPLKDLDAVTMYGPFIGAENVDKLSYTVPSLKYIDYLSEPDPAKCTTPADKKSVETIAKVLKQHFRQDYTWSPDHGSMENFVWAFPTDGWYARGLPFADPKTQQNIKNACRLYLNEFVFSDGPGRGWRPHRGRLGLSGPGSHAWGGFGDEGKLGSTSLQSVFSMAYYCDLWDVVKKNWNHIKKMYNTDLMCDGWMTFCRHSHAEWGDIGGPSIALARMADKVGDAEMYNYCSFLATRQMIGHFASLYGGQYFREKGPRDTDEKVPKTMFLSHQHHGMGWAVNGPGYAAPNSPGKEEQWDNRWVRFNCPDMGRFYRDSMQEALKKLVLNNEEVLNAKRMKNMRNKETHIRPGWNRIWGFCTDIPQDELTEKFPWTLEFMKHNTRTTDSTAICGALTVLYTDPNCLKLTQVVTPKPATPFIIGLERDPMSFVDHGLLGNFGGNFGQGNLGASYFKGKKGWFNLGYTWPLTDEEKQGNFQGRDRLCWTALSLWADYPQKNPIPGSESQFNSPWMAVGPFDHMTADGINVVFPPEKQINLGAKFTRRQGITEGKDKPPVKWQEVAPVSGKIDCTKLFGQKSWCIAYFLQYIHSPKDQEASLHLGHNGCIKVFLNGQEVFYIHKRNHAFKKENKIPVKLKKGWNKLLLKDACFWGKWELMAKILAPDGQPFNDLKYSAKPK